MAMDFEEVVELHYPALYRFAFSLTRQESDACDLTQQTFYIWAEKQAQLRDERKVKSWLFTTLHREFLGRRRKVTRFPQLGLEQAEAELPEVDPPRDDQIDAQAAVAALGQLDAPFRAAVALFYLEDYTHPEIASILEVPVGTVKSRISRGVAQLQKLLDHRPEQLAARRAP